MSGNDFLSFLVGNCGWKQDSVSNSKVMVYRSANDKAALILDEDAESVIGKGYKALYNANGVPTVKHGAALVTLNDGNTIVSDWYSTADEALNEIKGYDNSGEYRF